MFSITAEETEPRPAGTTHILAWTTQKMGDLRGLSCIGDGVWLLFTVAEYDSGSPDRIGGFHSFTRHAKGADLLPAVNRELGRLMILKSANVYVTRRINRLVVGSDYEPLFYVRPARS